MHSVLRSLLWLAGILSLGLGVTGVFVPLLPTTPFLLLAAACFARSSQRLHRWLLGHRIFGAYLRNYRRGPSMTRRHKVVTLLLLWTGLSVSATFGLQALWARFLLATVGAGVTVHLLWIRTAPPDKRAAQD